MEKELDKLKKLRDVYRDLGDSLEEAINVIERNDEEADLEAIFGKFLLKNLEAAALMESI